jgi:hypothetical protein
MVIASRISIVISTRSSGSSCRWRCCCAGSRYSDGSCGVRACVRLAPLIVASLLVVGSDRGSCCSWSL